MRSCDPKRIRHDMKHKSTKRPSHHKLKAKMSNNNNNNNNNKRKEPPPPSPGGGGGGGGGGGVRRSPRITRLRSSLDQAASNMSDVTSWRADAAAAAPPSPETMVLCQQCGHEVPAMNMAVHQASCGRGAAPGRLTRNNNISQNHPAEDDGSRGRRGLQQQQAAAPSAPPLEAAAAATTTNGASNEEEQEGWEVIPRGDAVMDVEPAIRRSTRASLGSVGVSSTVAAAPVAPSAPPLPPAAAQEQRRSGAVLTARRRTSRSPTRRASSDVTSTTSARGGRASSQNRRASPSQQQQPQGEWSCPRCTLINTPTSTRCDACELIRPGSRPVHRTLSRRSSDMGSGSNMPARRVHRVASFTGADAARIAREFERLPQLQQQQQQQQAQQPQQQQQQQQWQRQSQTASTVAAVAGTANSILSGAVIGSVFAGAPGALIGAAAGGIMDGITRWNNHRAAAAARAAGAGGDGQGSAAASGAAQGQGGRGRVTVTTRRMPGGMSFVMVRSNGPLDAEALMRASGSGAMPADFDNLSTVDRMIMQMLMASAVQQGEANPENMTYEELLRRFGVGTDNRGAEQSTIDTLPLTTLKNVEEELPSESERTCGICLEDFATGDEVRKLPRCGHVLHKECGDRWFRRVASCPICKTEVVEGEGGGQGGTSRTSASAASSRS